jgi:hypothetical protein
MPWLAIDMAGFGRLGRPALGTGDATVIDIADPHAVPVTVNPLEPGPGYPVQAHADRLAGLFEAAFGLAEPVAAALRTGLRRTYADCGWDTVTGAASPGVLTPPAVPSFRQFRTAVAAAVADLGYSPDMAAGVHGFLGARLDALWAGPAGRFLEGGHPVDVGSLLRGQVLVTSSGVADDEAASFLAGVLLVRLAEQRRPPGPRCTVVIGAADDLTGRPPGPSARLRAAGWFSRLLEDIRACGANIIVPGPGASGRSGPPGPPGPPGRTRMPGPGPGPAGASAARAGEAAVEGPTVLLGRRSAACGERCRRRPCNGYELHAAELLASDDGQAWLRLWIQALVLAFLTGRPLPCVPEPLRSGWQALSPRRRECVLATVIDTAVTARASALRPSYDPRCLMSVIAGVAAKMLDAAAHGGVPLSAGTVRPKSATPFRAGHVWVIPQLRWLHELERVQPSGPGRIRSDDIAPPLDFALTGLPDWPGIRASDRLSGLRRHSLSMESERNRGPATIALLGAGGAAALEADLATAGMGLGPQQRLRHVARLMGAGGHDQEPGWLEAVLSWPQQFIRPAANSDVRLTTTG